MKKLAGFLGVMALMAFAPLAHANYVLSYNSGAGATNCANVASNTLASCFATPTGIGGGITVTSFEGTSNSPGTAGGAQQIGSVVDISTTGAGTLTLWLAAQGFTAPTTPPNITDATSLTVIPTSGLGTVTLESCVDQSDGTAPPTGTFCSAPALTVTNPTINYSGDTSQSNNDSGVITSLAATFSLSEVITITFTEASEIEVQTRQVLTAVPEPGSIVLLGTVLVGLGTLIRKRVASQRG